MTNATKARTKDRLFKYCLRIERLLFRPTGIEMSKAFLVLNDELKLHLNRRIYTLMTVSQCLHALRLLDIGKG